MASLNRKRKRALVLTHNFPRYPGDMSGVFIKHLLTELRDSIDFTLLAPHDSGLNTAESVDGIDVRRFRYAADHKELLAYRGDMHTQLLQKPFMTWSFIRNYRNAAENLTREFSFDFIWGHWWIPGGWIAMKAKSGSNLPLVVTCHGTDVFLLDKFRWLKKTASGVFAGADQITVVSSFLKNRVVDAMSGRVADIGEKVAVAPMPVDPGVFSFDDSIGPVPGSIISASRLTSQKHVDKLIQAAYKLRADKIRFAVDIYGDGPERTKLEGMIANLKLDDCVHLNKPLPQGKLAEMYRKSQIAVLASEREGFGLALLEAMTCGCAAVGARSGGIADIIVNDGEDGVLVEPGDVESLYEALKHLLENGDYLERMRRKCRRSATERFSSKAVSRRFLKILERV